MLKDLKNLTVAATSDNSAKHLQGIIAELAGIQLDILPFDKEKRQILISHKDCAPAEYGWKTDKNTIILLCGAFVDLRTAAEKLLMSDVSSDCLFTAEGRYFEPLEHTTDALDSQSSSRIRAVLETENTDLSRVSGTVYYISEANGDDGNDGLSKERPFKTAAPLSDLSLSEGDTVLFERGGLYRGAVKVHSGVTYGSYGSGEKPIICGSRLNYAQGGLWRLHDEKNMIWCLDMPMIDPGIMVFNAHTRDVCAYGETTALRILDKPDRSGYDRLLEADDLSFYWGTPETKHETFDHRSRSYPIYLKSKCDPNSDFSDIEIGEDVPLFYIGDLSNVTIDNLCMKFCGGHAISGYKRVIELTVENCVFAWIGGSLLWKDTRYGNAIEIFGGCDGYKAKNNWIYEIYDTGITFQYHFSDGDPHMDNIVIANNIIERSYWLLEWWLSPDVKGAPCSSKNILIENNFLKFGFRSWGTLQHGIHVDDDGRACSWGAGIASGGLGDTAENIVIRRNILDRSFVESDEHVMTRLMNYYSGGSAAVTEWTDNCFIQYDDQFFARISNADGGAFYTADKQSIDTALSKIPVMNGEKICLIKKR